MEWLGELTYEYKIFCLRNAGYNNPYYEEYVDDLSEDEFWHFMRGLTKQEENENN